MYSSNVNVTVCTSRSILITPFLLILTKSTTASAQVVLETLFLAHPLKILPSLSSSSPRDVSDDAPVGTIRPGQLYRDLLPVLLPAGAEENLVGREDIGRAVWESFEEGVKEWEKEENYLIEKAKEAEKEKNSRDRPE